MSDDRESNVNTLRAHVRRSNIIRLDDPFIDDEARVQLSDDALLDQQGTAYFLVLVFRLSAAGVSGAAASSGVSSRTLMSFSPDVVA